MSISILSQCGEYQNNLSNVASKILELKIKNGEKVTEDDTQLIESDLYRVFVYIRDNCEDSAILSAAIKNLEKAVEVGEINVEKMANNSLKNAIIEVKGNVGREQSIKTESNTLQSPENSDLSMGIIFAITGMNLEEFLDKKMSDSEIELLYNNFRKSNEYQKNQVDMMTAILYGGDEEKKDAAADMYLTHESKESQEYFKKNKGTKADRGSLMRILQETLSPNPTIRTEAIIKLKENGWENIVLPNGNIDYKIAMEMFLSIEPETMPKSTKEKCSTQEEFLEILNSARNKHADTQLKIFMQDEKFRSEYEKCENDSERARLIYETHQKLEEDRMKKRAALKAMNQALKSDNIQELEQSMEMLYQMDTEFAKKTILKLATSEKANAISTPIMCQFVEKKYSNSKVLSTEENQEFKKDKVMDDGWTR